jgi:Tol biopolymer transport system component
MIADSPAWRPPDGRELLVRGRNADGRWDLFLVDVGSGGVHPLGLALTEAHPRDAFPEGHCLRSASWSPDGKRIAYEGCSGVPGGPAVVEVFPAGGASLVHVVAADGTGDRVVDGSPPEIEQLMPRWSPDGSRLLLVQRRQVVDTPAEEWWWGVVDPDGGSRVDLGSVAQNINGTADWSPDGTRVISVTAWPWDGPPPAPLVRLFDPTSGAEVELDWTSTDQPAWQRLAP